MLRINVLLDILLIYGLSTYGAMTPIVYLICEIPQTQLKLKVSLSASQCACTVEIGALLVCISFRHCSNLYAFLNTYYHTQGHTGMFVIILKEPPTPKPCDT